MYELLIRGSYPNCYLIYKIVQEESTFEGAVKRLNETEVIAPAYYIVSGIKSNEGVVIERERRTINAYYTLNETNWYLVQTNYDRNVSDPKSDYRRIPAEQKMNAMG